MEPTAGRNVELFSRFEEHGGAWERMEKWMDIPLGDPREKAYREKELANDIYILYPSPFMSTMERAARCESCDWQQPIREGNFISILLPEIQQSRTYARLLSAKAHLEIAQGKYDQAVRTLQTGYAEARQVAQSPTLVSGLVGVTIASIMSYQVQQFIQQPDAPNLYWALSTLPRPLVDFRLAGEAESKILYLQFPELRDLEQEKALARRVAGTARQGHAKPVPMHGTVDAAAGKHTWHRSRCWPSAAIPRRNAISSSMDARRRKSRPCRSPRSCSCIP